MTRLPVVLTVLAGLVACQVLGGFCPMVASSAVAAASLEGARIGHAMGGEGLCMVSLPAAPKPFDAGDVHHAPLLASWQAVLGVPRAAFGVSLTRALPTEAGPPLYVCLSLFRI